MSNIYLLFLLNWVETVFFCDIRIYQAAVLSSRWCNQHHSFCIVIILLFIIIILITLFRRTHLVAWPLNSAQKNYEMTAKVECLLRFKASPVKIALRVSNKLNQPTKYFGQFHLLCTVVFGCGVSDRASNKDLHKGS